MKGRRIYDDGGRVANTILDQLGGAGRLRAMTGAYNFYDIGNGLSFKIKNARANYIKIKLTSMDLYDVEVGRIRGNTYKVVDSAQGLYFDQLKPFIEKATGMYLSLYGKGGMIEHKTDDGKTLKYKIDENEMSVEVDFPTMEYLSDYGIVMKKEARKLKDTYIFWYDEINSASKEELEETLKIELPLYQRGYEDDERDDYDDYARGGGIDDKHRIYFSSLSEVIDAIHDIASENGYDVVEIFPDLNYGGISYGQTKKVKVELKWNGKEKVGKSKRRETNTLNVSIYRMDSGNYELVSYFSYEKGGMMADGGNVSSYKVNVYGRMTSKDYYGVDSKSTALKWFKLNGKPMTRARAEQFAKSYIQRLGRSNVHIGGMEYGGMGKGSRRFTTNLGYEDGGQIDLFEEIESLPDEVQNIIQKYSSEDETYGNLEDFLSELQPLGYTFEYGLDAVPYDLRKMADGGIMAKESDIEKFNQIIDKTNLWGDLYLLAPEFDDGMMVRNIRSEAAKIWFSLGYDLQDLKDTLTSQDINLPEEEIYYYSVELNNSEDGLFEFETREEAFQFARKKEKEGNRITDVSKYKKVGNGRYEREQELLDKYNNYSMGLRLSSGRFKSGGIMADGGIMANGGYFEMEEEEDEVDYNSISYLEDELRRLVRWSNEYGSKGADAKIEQLRKKIEYLKTQNADGGRMAKGGKVKKRVRFVDKVESIADRLEGTKVPKRLKKDYGGKYNREEAEEAARRIAGAQLRDRKM